MTTWANLFLRGTVGTNRALLRRSHLPAAAVLSVADLKIASRRAPSRTRRQANRVNFKRVRIARVLMLNAGRRVTRDLSQSELF